MKKDLKKLTLCKETIQQLEELAQGRVQGGLAPNQVRRIGPSFASDCCLTNNCGTWFGC